MKPRAERIYREESVYADGSRSTRECRSERMYQVWRALAANPLPGTPSKTVTFLIGTITWEEA